MWAAGVLATIQRVQADHGRIRHELCDLGCGPAPVASTASPRRGGFCRHESPGRELPVDCGYRLLYKRRGSQPHAALDRAGGGTIDDDREGPALTDETHRELGRRVSLEVVLAALRLLPVSATVFIEGTSIAPEASAFLTEHAQEPGREDLSGIIWPRSEQFHVALGPAVLDGLDELAERHAVPELMDHLVVYDGDLVLLAAYDLGSDPILISRDLPTDVTQRIADLVAK